MARKKLFTFNSDAVVEELDKIDKGYQSAYVEAVVAKSFGIELGTETPEAQRRTEIAKTLPEGLEGAEAVPAGEPTAEGSVLANLPEEESDVTTDNVPGEESEVAAVEESNLEDQPLGEDEGTTTTEGGEEVRAEESEDGSGDGDDRDGDGDPEPTEPAEEPIAEEPGDSTPAPGFEETPVAPGFEEVPTGGSFEDVPSPVFETGQPANEAARKVAEAAAEEEEVAEYPVGAKVCPTCGQVKVTEICLNCL